jgi:DNA-directed RNA polymerase specialized sigma24 family protein
MAVAEMSLEMPSERLVVAAHAGDPAAFSALVDRYRDTVFAYAFARLRDRDFSIIPDLPATDMCQNTNFCFIMKGAIKRDGRANRRANAPERRREEADEGVGRGGG